MLSGAHGQGGQDASRHEEHSCLEAPCPPWPVTLPLNITVQRDEFATFGAEVLLAQSDLQDAVPDLLGEHQLGVRGHRQQRLAE
jgi:hypothetical protein